MEIEQETAVQIDIVNCRADQGMPGVTVQECHLRREPTGQAQIPGIEAGDVVVAGTGDRREASVQRGHDAAVHLLSEEVRVVGQVGRQPQRGITAVVHDEDHELRAIQA